MRKFQNNVAAVLVLLLFSVPALFAQSGEPLRWKFKQGDDFKVEMSQSATQEINAGGPQTVEMKFVMHLSMSVEAVREHEFDVTQKIERIVFSLDSPTFAFDFDSASDEEPDAQAAMFVDGLKPLVGFEVKQTINDRGESLNVELDESKLQEAQQSPLAARLISKDSFKQLLAANGLVFPEQALSQGDTWNGTFEQASAGMTISTKSTFTLAGTEETDAGTLHKITSVNDIEMVPGENAEASVELNSQKSTGEFLFDNTAGYLRSATLNQDMEMSVDQGGMQMDVKSKSTSKFTMTPAK